MVIQHTVMYIAYHTQSHDFITAHNQLMQKFCSTTTVQLYNFKFERKFSPCILILGPKNRLDSMSLINIYTYG